MPYSSSIGKNEIGIWIKEINFPINRILDVGAGSGTYAKLIKNRHRSYRDAEWIAVEAWQDYIKKFNLNELYDKIIVNDIKKVDLQKEIGQVDISFAGDVLEHFIKSDAEELLQKLLDISKIVIISLPTSICEQDAYEGNPYEIHLKPDWSHEEVLETWGKFIKKSHNGIEPHNSVKIGTYWLEK
jgi:hypothetical protein